MHTSIISPYWQGIWTQHGVCHKAQEVVIELDIVETGEGNKAVINYNNPEGWLNYRKLSDKYAQEIRETIKM